MPNLKNYTGPDYAHYFDAGEPNVIYEESRGLVAIVPIGHNEPLRICTKKGVHLPDFIKLILSNTNPNQKQCDILDKRLNLSAMKERSIPETFIEVQNKSRPF